VAVRAGAVEELVNPDFWRGRRVFLTGHTGFKGSWLSLWLKSLGAEVSGLALEPGVPGMFVASRLKESIRSIIGDIRDYATVERAMREAAPEVVFHMAAQPLVRESYSQPLETYASNVMGTAHVLEAVRHSAAVRAAVVITTDKCYENLETERGYRESDRLGGHDPYSSSKACAELVSLAYRKSFFEAGSAGRALGLATARAGNVIGGGDWGEDRLIPDVVRALAGGARPALRNPGAIRPWQHVLEPLRGYLMLAERLVARDAAAYSEAWNFGPREADARTVEWVAARFLDLWGTKERWGTQPGNHPYEAHWLKLDISKAAARLGWTPALPLEQAIQDTVDWYRRHLAGEDMREASLRQIAAYSQRVRDAVSPIPHPVP